MQNKIIEVNEETDMGNNANRSWMLWFIYGS